MKAVIRLKEGNYFTGETPSGHLMHWDSGPEGAVTKGPTPMEGLLQAGAVCSAMDVASILRKRRKEISYFELDVEAVRAENYPKVFTTYKITYRISGDDITHEEVEKAVKLSQEKYCSVLNMLKSDLKVESEVILV